MGGSGLHHGAGMAHGHVDTKVYTVRDFPGPIDSEISCWPPKAHHDYRLHKFIELDFHDTLANFKKLTDI